MTPGNRSHLNLITIKLIIAFDGARYAGWQTQKVGLGVQQVVEEAFAKIFGTAIPLHSSSRTDTGVHAIGMVAHVELPKELLRSMTMRKVPLALNAHLPEDIRVLHAALAAEGFHARFNASGKEYRYFVWNHHAMNPLLRGHAWLVAGDLDIGQMRTAAQLFTGTHDFEAFSGTRNYRMKSTVRTLSQCTIKKSGRLLTFILRGDGFLYKMCRNIVGTLVQIGQGKYRAADAAAMLRSKDRRCAGMTAPSVGLVLWKVFYGKKAGPAQPLANDE